MASGSRAVLDILEVIGRVCGRAGCLKKNTFLITSSGKIEKCVSLSDNAISNPLARRKIDIACFSKSA